MYEMEIDVWIVHFGSSTDSDYAVFPSEHQAIQSIQQHVYAVAEASEKIKHSSLERILETDDLSLLEEILEEAESMAYFNLEVRGLTVNIELYVDPNEQ